MSSIMEFHQYQPFSTTSPFLSMFIGTLFLFSSNVVQGFIGVNWGRMTSQRLIPSTVVDLLLQNRITNVKVASYSINVMKAFSGSGIHLTISIPNENLQHFTTVERAQEWVHKYVTLFRVENVDIRYVFIGAEPLSPTFRKVTFDNAVDVMRLIHIALDDAGHRGQVDVILAHYIDILQLNHSKPSEAEFRDNIKDKMIQQLEILKEANLPFAIGMTPVHYVTINNLDLQFAFVNGNSTYFVTDDNGLNYTNVFDFMYDSVLWAMKKADAPNVKLMVSAIGWPTDGYPNANIENAERFWKGLLPKVTGKKGTPLRPGQPIDTFIVSLCDENKVNTDYGTFQRHWGIYRTDGKPKYKIDFSGQGRDIYPTSANGVTYMPTRWCIFNGDVTNLTVVKHEFERACEKADCTTLMPGGSCSHLDFNQSISYAFNRYFQAASQKLSDEACQFGGLGMVVPDNPSVGKCVFPVEILDAEVADLRSSLGAAFIGDATLRSVSKFTLFLPLVFSNFLLFV